MARQSKPQLPKHPAQLTPQEMKSGIDRLKKCLEAVQSFNPQSVTDQFNTPELDALEASIDEALVRTFGADTLDYERYKFAKDFNRGPYNSSYHVPPGEFQASNKGRTIITKFREEAAEVGFAVVLMTPDDLGKGREDTDLRPRARQNVIFELGFFIGALRPEHVAALVKGDIDLPSDYDGVVYISMDKEDWRTKLATELEAAHYDVDWNKVMRS